MADIHHKKQTIRCERCGGDAVYKMKLPRVSEAGHVRLYECATCPRVVFEDVSE